MDGPGILALPEQLLSRLDVGWSLVLLLTRYTSMMMFLPGIGGGPRGLTVRYPLILMLACLSLATHPSAVVPTDIAAMAGQIFSELTLGAAVSIIPLMILAGAQTAGQVASGTMGLNASQLIDPTMNVSLSDLSRIYSDLSIIIFLALGGHHLIIAELAGLDGAIQPGSFVLGAIGTQAIVDQSSKIFEIGCMIAAPVIVALLLTNFVMALISKAVPTVNIFMLSFPLTIGIGFVLSILALPEVSHYMQRQFMDLEGVLRTVLVPS